ncbi:MAG: hypothetical protein MJK08_04070 [Campylobacterales bacterium]|nr:hypothetical protein [Campylobacterales bacterium]
MKGISAIKKMFEDSKYIYSVQSLDSPESKVITIQSFIINGVDMFPIFPTRKEATNQLQGSDYLDMIVGVKSSFLAHQLQDKEYAILNPGSPQSSIFKTCLVKEYAGVPKIMTKKQTEGVRPNTLDIENSTIPIMTHQLYMHYEDNNLTGKIGDPEWENQALYFWCADERFERKSLPPIFKTFNKKYFYIKNANENLSLMSRKATPWFDMEGYGDKFTIMLDDQIIALRELKIDKQIEYVELVALTKDNMEILNDNGSYSFIKNSINLDVSNDSLIYKDQKISISEAFFKNLLVIIKIN